MVLGRALRARVTIHPVLYLMYGSPLQGPVFRPMLMLTQLKAKTTSPGSTNPEGPKDPDIRDLRSEIPRSRDPRSENSKIHDGDTFSLG